MGKIEKRKIGAEIKCLPDTCPRFSDLAPEEVEEVSEDEDAAIAAIIFQKNFVGKSHTRDFSISSKLLLTLLIYFWNEFKEKKGDFLLSFAV